jgi:hypothetical protein
VIIQLCKSEALSIAHTITVPEHLQETAQLTHRHVACLTSSIRTQLAHSHRAPNHVGQPMVQFSQPMTQTSCLSRRSRAQRRTNPHAARSLSVEGMKIFQFRRGNSTQYLSFEGVIQTCVTPVRSTCASFEGVIECSFVGVMVFAR